MPSTYTHYRFGLEVIERCDLEKASVIRKHKELFFIGLHGPDILFYYSPLKRNEVNRVGYSLHEKTAVEFFDYARVRLHKMLDKEAGMAYMLGMVCHFALDSECHGYIEHVIHRGKLTHTEIETEFERQLLLQDGKNIRTYNTASHIEASEKNACIISSFFKTLGSYQIYKALRGMKRYNQLLVPSNKGKEWLAVQLLHLTNNYEKMHGLIMDGKQEKECKESNRELKRRYLGAREVALYLVDDFYRKWNTVEELSLRFHRTFGPDQIEIQRYDRRVSTSVPEGISQ